MCIFNRIFEHFYVLHYLSCNLPVCLWLRNALAKIEYNCLKNALILSERHIQRQGMTSNYSENCLLKEKQTGDNSKAK